MMLLFTDSFDGYDTADPTVKGYTVENGTPNYGGAGNVRTGTGALKFTNNQFSSPFNVRRDFTTPVVTMIVGFAFRRSANFVAGTLLEFKDNVGGGIVHIRFGIDVNDKLVVWRGAGSTLLATGTANVPYAAWCYLEFKVTVDDAAGVAVARLNETTDINFSGDTRNGGTAAQIDRLVFYQPGAVQMDIDDLYILDGTGTPNDFLGDIKVECLRPTGNGNSSQLVGNDGNSVDNYLLVDETTPNGDTDYVESSTVSDKDTYAYGNLAATAGTVYGVQVNTWARKTDAGVRKIASVARVSATEEDSADFTLSNSYEFHMDQRVTKPGGGAWTISDVNGAEFGVKVTA